MEMMMMDQAVGGSEQLATHHVFVVGIDTNQ